MIFDLAITFLISTQTLYNFHYLKCLVDMSVYLVLGKQTECDYFSVLQYFKY